MPNVAIADAARVPGDVRSAVADRHAIADVIDGLPAGSDVVLVSNDLAGWRESRAIRLAYGQERIGLLHVDAPPTAFFLVMSALAMLRDDELGLASATVSLTTRVIATQALLSSVTSLDRPAPRFAQQLASLWPSTRYLVDWDTQQVVRARTITRTDGRAAIVARSSRGFEGDEGPWPAERIELAVGSAAPWRASRWLEVTTLREPLETVLEAVRRLDHAQGLSSCPSCARAGGGPRCVFCQLPLGDADRSALVSSDGGPA